MTLDNAALRVDACQKWGILWRSSNRLDGEREWLMWENGKPLIFRTRAEARTQIREHYAYVKTRSDLRNEPHGWKLPIPVKIRGIQWQMS